MAARGLYGTSIATRIRSLELEHAANIEKAMWTGDWNTPAYTCSECFTFMGTPHLCMECISELCWSCAIDHECGFNTDYVDYNYTQVFRSEEVTVEGPREFTIIGPKDSNPVYRFKKV